MKVARWSFRLAGIYGILVMLPQYFLEARIGRDFPPPITHPEHFYGFIGLALVWQLAFLILSRDPIRYRPLMIPAILEKLAFGVPAVLLFAGGRSSQAVLGFGLIDLALAVLFTMAFVRTAERTTVRGERCEVRRFQGAQFRGPGVGWCPRWDTRRKGGRTLAGRARETGRP